MRSDLREHDRASDWLRASLRLVPFADIFHPLRSVLVAQVAILKQKLDSISSTVIFRSSDVR